MKKKLLSLLLAAVSCATLCLTGCGGNASETTVESDLAKQNYYRGEELLKATVDNYFDREYNIVNQYYDFPNREMDDSIIADIWHFSSLQEAAMYYQEISNTEYADELADDLYETLQYFVEERSNDDYIVYGMYAAAEPGKNNEGEDLFDDNSCIVRNVIHQYKNTGDEAYYTAAENTMDWVLKNGWDTKINTDTGEEFGGNFQGFAGTGMTYKPICANEFNMLNLIQFYNLSDTEEEKDYYLNWAKKYYEFCIDTYRADSGLIADYIGLNLDRNDSSYHGAPALMEHPYSYHQGAMIEAGVRMYKATGDETYLDDARMTADACIEIDLLGTFINGIYQPPVNEYHWFNLCFLRGLMMLAQVDETYDEQVQLFQESIDYAYENYYMDGFLPSNFVQGWLQDYEYDTRINVMDASAYAQYYFMLAIYQDGKEVA